jgi:hypothetical protein
LQRFPSRSEPVLARGRSILYVIPLVFTVRVSPARLPKE